MFDDIVTSRYASLQFGLENSPPSQEIFSSDSGERLGGKKAAIQFYHDTRMKTENSPAITEEEKILS